MIERLAKKEIAAFAKKNVTNDFHLRRWTPIRYIDNSRETGISPEMVGNHAVVVGMLLKADSDTTKDGRRYVKLKVRDRISGEIFNVFLFGKGFLFAKFMKIVGQDVFIAGKLGYKHPFGYSIVPVVSEIFNSSCFKVIPVYSRVKGVTEKNLSEIMERSTHLEEEETVPEELRRKYNLTPINDAVRYVLKPKNMQEVLLGKKRLLFDDLFYMAASFEKKRRENSEGPEISIKSTEIMEEAIRSLPFKLTEDQEKTARGIVDTLKTGEHLDALVQGDVGCGKTITAFLPMIAVAENGYQTCIVAPTKILAEQHYQKLTDLLKGKGIDVRLFSGPKIIQADRDALKDGTCLIAVGTHSLFQESIEFQKLRMIVIDEEQKFGVLQRQTLSQKSRGITSISMSATPIPRTLALAIYGDRTKVFNIRTAPSGRKPVITQYDDGNRRESCVKWILQKKQQVYVVCPAIGDDDKQDIGVLTTKQAKEIYRKMLPDAVVEDLDGSMKEQDTEKILERFRAGEINVLVSTTVVEVGVDVPNATLMIIENAERFGLSQMHQLRGRVGRNSLQSYCLLISEKSPLENKRFDIMCRTTDGFEIAEKDLEELRKSGNLFGEEQSGRNVYVEEMLMYGAAYKRIAEDARDLPDEVLDRHIEKIMAADIRTHKKPIVFRR